MVYGVRVGTVEGVVVLSGDVVEDMLGCVEEEFEVEGVVVSVVE